MGLKSVHIGDSIHEEAKIAAIKFKYANLKAFVEKSITNNIRLENIKEQKKKEKSEGDE